MEIFGEQDNGFSLVRILDFSGKIRRTKERKNAGRREKMKIIFCFFLKWFGLNYRSLKRKYFLVFYKILEILILSQIYWIKF